MSRIVGGNFVQVSDAWGWMGSLRKNNLHICGASLLSPYFAITAAHCLQDLMSTSQLSLNFGSHRWAVIGDLHSISRVIIHPGYNELVFTNDLAILALTQPVDMVRFNITPICLPEQYNFDDITSESPPAGQSLVAIGWGSETRFRPKTSAMLRQVTIEAISNEDEICVNATYDNLVQFCAGTRNGGKDTCSGDSGGPLMMYRDGRWYLMGITSFGSQCGDSNRPGVYTRVSYYSSFIRYAINSCLLYTSPSPRD